jgi:hypothetical protein
VDVRVLKEDNDNMGSGTLREEIGRKKCGLRHTTETRLSQW